MKAFSVDIEAVRELTDARCGPDDALNFYPVARELGASRDEAERIDAMLTARVMCARGAI